MRRYKFNRDCIFMIERLVSYIIKVCFVKVPCWFSIIFCTYQSLDEFCYLNLYLCKVGGQRANEGLVELSMRYHPRDIPLCLVYNSNITCIINKNWTSIRMKYFKNNFDISLILLPRQFFSQFCRYIYINDYFNTKENVIQVHVMLEDAYVLGWTAIGWFIDMEVYHHKFMN